MNVAFFYATVVYLALFITATQTSALKTSDAKQGVFFVATETQTSSLETEEAKQGDIFAGADKLANNVGLMQSKAAKSKSKKSALVPKTIAAPLIQTIAPTPAPLIQTIAPTSAPLIKCNTTQKSGGQGTTVLTINMQTTSGTFKVTYDMKDKQPDQLTINYEGDTIYDSGLVKGKKTVDVSFSGSSSIITVTINAPQAGTRWEVTVGCPS